LEAGDVFTVPKGMRHCPTVVGEEDVVCIVVEKVGTINSGDAGFVQGLTNEVEDVRQEGK
jgi:gentisate 1,2-dioxygenase